ncbi:hypothetical protein ACFWFI_03475 [Streptomyces sp. NPDC060209]|uniref:hypothetical protein n=1 Tax=Streptomyces sp. NPDC060209 TaxID=3347073 RepID=UPI00365B6DF9
MRSTSRAATASAISWVRTPGKLAARECGPGGLVGEVPDRLHVDQQNKGRDHRC